MANQWLQWFWSADEAAQVSAFDDLPSDYKRIYCDYSPDLAHLGPSAQLHRLSQRGEPSGCHDVSGRRVSL